ncbi:MAG: hypothetical protein ACKVOQ_01470 [Cyclobacteriaceae bacterium]
MKKYILLFAITIIGLVLHAQQKFPVTGNTTLNPPYSAYLSDFISPGSNILKFNFVFNDFREPTWQVRLRIKIESVDLKLQTRPEFKPSAPLVVTPGVSVPLSSADFVEYFDFKNLSILGASSNAFLQNGRFPEGNYTFCIEVLDYPTGIVLSNLACATAWIRLNDPPRVISPQCDAFVDPFVPLNIPFQWQLFNAISPNATQGTEYKLVVYEVTDPYANPFTSIANGKVLQVFESDALQQTSFNYNLSSPALDIGKTYVYQIRAKDIGGRDLFKNNGLSEVCWFHYGYPENGKIQTSAPLADKNFKKAELAYFRWAAPDLKIRNQPFLYEVKIAAISDGQTPEQAIENNTPWHVERTFETTSTSGLDMLVRKPLKPGLQYAWQITAYSGRQTVAKSDVQKFIGPPVIDSFYAGRHLVSVIKANNNDSLNFSGIGKFRRNLTDSIEIPFEKLKLKRIVSYWVLEEGELMAEIQNPQPIPLQPRKSQNGNATFYPRSVKLSRAELALEGEVQWQLPHATKDGKLAFVKSDRTWLNYDRYQLLGSAKLSSQNFELLDPLDFNLQLSPESDFLISQDKFELRFQGNIQLPEKVKGKQRGKITMPFPRTGQLFYLDSLKVETSDIAPINNTRIYLHPALVTVDLSEGISPGSKSSDPFWKGVYFREYEVDYNSFTDKLSQLRFKKEVIHVFNGTGNQSNPWVDGLGLNFTLSSDFKKDTIYFNSFFGRINHFDLKIERNRVSSSALTGEILLPVFSATDFYSFTIPVTDEGLQAGYLDNFDDKPFTFNKGGGEQEIIITVKRGAFEEQRLINMSLTVEWPSLKITAQSVSDFKIWGDYKIGFGIPYGTKALDTQLQGTLSGYPVTLDGIAAGSSEGYYSFAVTGKTHMGDDVAGQNGPPSLNIFSTIQNKWAPAAPAYIPGQPQRISESEVTSVKQEFATTSNKIEQDINATSEETKREANEALNKLTAQQTTAVTIGDATKNFSTAATDPTITPQKGGLLSKLNPKQQEIVKEIISTVIDKLTKPLRDSIDRKAAQVNKRIQDETDKIIAVAQRQVEDKVTSLVFAIAQKVIDGTKNNKVDLSAQIEQLANVVVKSVTTEVNNSIKASINKNITTPFTDLVQVQIADRVNNYIQVAATKIVISSLEGSLNLEAVPQALVAGVDTVLSKIASKVFDQINFSSLSNMIGNTANDALKGINTDKIVHEIEAGAKTIAVNTLVDVASKTIGKAASDFINKQIGVHVPINFSRSAQRWSVKYFFSLDSVNVQLKTKILELNGFVFYKKDQPLYGNVWVGDIDVLVKHPKEFSLKVIYLNGRTADDQHYWFAQISPNDGTTYKLGDVLPKKARALQSPVNLGVADMVGVSGRVYRHMKDGDAKPILPDYTNDYGAYLNIILFDRSNSGTTMRLDLAGEYIMGADKNYVVTFDGNLQLMNKSPKVLEIDPAAAVKGIVRFSYNSAEQHFLGYGRVEINKPGQLCATASVLVDTKPGKWRVEVGSREDRVIFIPACAGWSPTGWLAITESEAELGLGVQYSFKFQTPNMNFGIVTVNIYFDAGVAFGVQVAIRYKPNFALLRAGIWADVWADVGINYEFPWPFDGWQRFSVLSLYARGDLLMIFEPSPVTLQGRLKGYVRLLSIVDINFDASFKQNL